MMKRKMTFLTFLTKVKHTQSLLYCYVNLCCHGTLGSKAGVKIAEARMRLLHYCNGIRFAALRNFLRGVVEVETL